MSEQFDWRTDDEVGVDEPISETGTAVTHRISWLATIAILIFLALGIRVASHQIGKRIETAQKSVEQEILLAYDLVRQANWQQDAELLRSLLSGRDPDWVNLQLDLVAEGRLFDRTGLDLLAKTDIEQVQVVIAPDLESAELVYEQVYVLQDGDGVTETVRLQQTAVYRRGQQWLYAPPTDDYWGSWQIVDGRSLSIAYRQRDGAVVTKLAFDFEALVAEVCRLPDIDCPSDLHLHLRLDSNPESLRETADPQTLLDHTLHLNLPTPSLVGLPVDEAGYQALLQGYGIHLAAAIISQQARYTCCDHGLFHRALLDWQLHQLGLRPWLLTTADYDQLLYENKHLEEIRQSWNVNINSPNWHDVYLLVQFLATNPAHLSPITSQRLLNEDLHYNDWLAQVAGADVPKALLQFIIDQSSLSSSAEPPIPLPQEDILYVCDDGQKLQRQDFQTGTAANVATPDDAVMSWELWPLPDGYMMEGRYLFNIPDLRPQPHLIRVDDNDRYITLFDSYNENNPDQVTFFSRVTDPTARYFMVTLSSMAGGAFTPALLDSADCEEDACHTYPLSGWPLWSPLGQNMLLLGETADNSFPRYAPLYLANTQGQNRVRLADEVTTYAWLDNQTMAYVRLDGREQVIIARELGSGLELVIARSSDLQRILPNADPNDVLQLFSLQVSPTDPNLLLITAAMNQRLELTYYFLLQREVEAVTINHLPMPSNTFYNYFSPDGRLLISPRANPGGIGAGNTLSIYNLETGQQRSLAARDWQFDWSADGNWIASPYDQYLLLMAPAYNYAQAIPGDYANCGNIIWVNP